MYEFLLHEPLANKSKHNHEDHSHEHHHADARSVDKKILKISLLMTFSMIFRSMMTETAERLRKSFMVITQRT